MKKLLLKLFVISCLIAGLYSGYLLSQHTFSILSFGEGLFLWLTILCTSIWLGRRNKDGLYRLLKDVHQSNLDDIEQQQLEEPVDEVVVKEQITNSVAMVNLFGLALMLAICCITFLIGQESIGLVDWLIVLSIISAPLIIGFLVGEWFIDKDDIDIQELEEIDKFN